MARAGQFWTVDSTLVHAPRKLKLSTEGMLCLPEKSPAVTDSLSVVADAVDVSLWMAVKTRANLADSDFWP
jgi:hypothetical protein